MNGIEKVLPMTAVKIDDRLTVASQPSPETLATLATAGFATIINNRPDAEEPGQPGSAAEKAACERAGLAYRFIPVTAATITEADIRAFQAAVSEARGPVYAHCRSGVRSLTLHVLGEVLAGRMKRGAPGGVAPRTGGCTAGGSHRAS